MRRIVSEQQKGIPIGNLRIKGFVNKGYIGSPEERDSLRSVNLPPLYKELPHKPVIPYVQQRYPGEIRILSQRGCSWGKCVFCTQIDKKMFFPISVDHLIQRVQKEIEAANSSGKPSSITITFDSDENSIEMFIQFIKHLNSLHDFDEFIDIILWIQVKSFRKEIAEAMANINNKKIRVLLKLNFESLNFDTLRNMRKGHSPLQAIEAAKATQDVDQSYITHYFTHYPLENIESVAREAEILKRIAHLLMPPKGGGIFFPYGSNNRDTIYENQDKYKVKIRRLKKDTWLKDVFGIDLPFSQWAHAYDEKPSLDLERLLVYTYYKTIKASDAVNRPRQRAEINWGEVKTPLVGRIALFYRYLKLFGWKIIHYSLQLIGKGKAFRRRTQIFQYFSTVMDLDPSNAEHEDDIQNICKIEARMISGNANVRQSHFFLKHNCLEKEYNGPGTKEKWSIPLNSNELKVLRCLYWSRKQKKVLEILKNEISEQEITEIIDRHINLGSVVQFRGVLLSVVNDPEYWK